MYFLNSGPIGLDVFCSEEGLRGCTLNTPPKGRPIMHLVRLYLNWAKLVSCE